MLDQIEAFFSLLDRAKKWRAGKKQPTETVATRFVRLCENYGVHRNQIPRFIGHGLTLQDVQNDALLLAKLDEAILQDVCERFAVRREWLDGAETEIYPQSYFYKYPELFSKFIKDLKAKNPEGRFEGILVAPKELTHDESTVLILQETIGFIGEKPIYRLHLCDNWVLNYWKSCACLTACIAIAWKEHAYIRGIYMSEKEIKSLLNGDTLLGFQGEGIYGIRGRKWYPEDMALYPEAFLSKIAPERENSGIKSGLELWLYLEQEGWMDFDIKKDSRRLFQQELRKYTP